MKNLLKHLMPLAKIFKKVDNKHYGQARETSFVWEYPNLEKRDLLIKVTQWTMYASGVEKPTMMFRGLAQISSGVMLYINGGVFPSTSDEYGLPLDWNNFPETFEGYLDPVCISPYDDRYVGSIELTLFCHPDQMDWLYRAFNYGTDNPNDCPLEMAMNYGIKNVYRTFDYGTDTNKNGVLIATKIFYPDKDEMGDEFWKDSWRSKYLAVRSWHAVWGQTFTG